MKNKNFIKLASVTSTCSVVISSSIEAETQFLTELASHTQFKQIQNLDNLNIPLSVLKLDSNNFETVATQLLNKPLGNCSLICLLPLADYNQLETIPVFNEFNAIFSPILRI